MLKVLINEEEVLTNKDFTIKKEMLNTPSVILNNVYPKSWEDEKDYTSNFYHPQDYSKCKIIDETIIPASDGETITGTSFTIQDYDSTKLVELTELDGNTTQAGTPTPSSPQPINVVSGRQEVSVVGKNLFDYRDLTTKTNAGLTVINTNGELSISGTSTSTSFLNIIEDTLNLKAGTYTMSAFNPIASSDSGMDLRITKTGGSGIVASVYLNVANNKKTFTLSEDLVNGRLIIRTSNGQTLTNFKLSPMIEKGSTASEYEAYKGQSYEINLGKNLFDISTANYTYKCTLSNEVYTTNSLITSDRSVNFGYSANNNYTIYPNETYYISADIRLVSGTAKNVNVLAMNSSGTRLMITNPDFTNEFQRYLESYTNNTESPKVLGRLLFQPVKENLDNAVFEIKNVMISKSSDIDYAPYKTPIELCKINTYKDMIFRSKGVNLFDKDTMLLNMYFDVGTMTLKSNSQTYIAYAKVPKNTNITISKTSITNRFRIGFCDTIPELNSSFVMSNVWENDTQTLSATINSGNYEYVLVQYTNSGQNTDIQINEGSTALPYEPYNSKGKWLLHKEIGKVVLDGSETWTDTGITGRYMNRQVITNGITLSNTIILMSNYFKGIAYDERNNISYASIYLQNNYLGVNNSGFTSTSEVQTWLTTHNTTVYYVLATPTTTEITDSELISQLNAIELLEGLNNVSVSSADLPGEITIHYNYNEEQIIDDLLFCGVVKNSGNISLNPRQPHFQSLQILDFKTFLSEGELDSFVIYQKTILEAIQTVIANIQDYGFVLGNVNILNPNDIIGAYSTKDKTAYDVFNYIADITQSRWTTRLIDENHVAIDFYDPTLMVEGTPINYTQAFFENNLIDDMTYSYGSNNYRNKQVMTSSQVYSNISQQQSIVANGYQTQFPTEQPIGKINSITSNGIPLTFATFNEKEMGYVADFYYQPGENYFKSENLRSTGEILIIDYVAIVEGRQIITNPLEINRISDSTGRKGIISRYEQRNDATTSTELQKIGESYIKYKGTPEIKLKISTRKNIWEVGQRVQFNAPITELDTEYMIRTKKINYISTIDTIFYEYELISSFNSETEINYFDNQRAKASGNIGEGEYISRNIDIESTANIIFYDTETTEVQVSGDNELNSILNSPFIS